VGKYSENGGENDTEKLRPGSATLQECHLNGWMLDILFDDEIFAKYVPQVSQFFRIIWV
jgi:hypothetical protein